LKKFLIPLFLQLSSSNPYFITATDQAKEEKLNEFILVHDQIMDFFIFKMDDLLTHGWLLMLDKNGLSLQ
jgi:hypothetical protein